MRKEVTKFGSGVGFYFNKKDQKLYDVNEGDIFEVKIKKLRHGGNKK